MISTCDKICISSRWTVFCKYNNGGQFTRFFMAARQFLEERRIKWCHEICTYVRFQTTIPLPPKALKFNESFSKLTIQLPFFGLFLLVDTYPGFARNPFEKPLAAFEKNSVKIQEMCRPIEKNDKIQKRTVHPLTIFVSFYKLKYNNKKGWFKN